MIRLAKSKRVLGFNLIEAAIVLGVVGLIIGGIWVAASAVSRAQKIDRTVSAIHLTMNKLSNLYRNQTFPTAVTDLTPMLISAGAIPANLIQNTSALSGWGGLMFYEKVGGLDSIQIYLYSVPRDLCVAFLNEMAKSTARNVGGTTFSLY